MIAENPILFQASILVPNKPLDPRLNKPDSMTPTKICAFVAICFVMIKM